MPSFMHQQSTRKNTTALKGQLPESLPQHSYSQACSLLAENKTPICKGCILPTY
jgi:hypothetical protein